MAAPDHGREPVTWFRRLVVAVALIALSPACSHALDDPLVISAKYYFIGGITIGASLKEVHAAFGQPKKSEAAPFPAFCKDRLAEDYGGVKAVFCNGRLLHLSCFAKGFKTPSGIEVGMGQAEVLKKQGNTIVRESDGGQVIRYRAASPDKFLIIHFKNGRVVEIELWFGQT